MGTAGIIVMQSLVESVAREDNFGGVVIGKGDDEPAQLVHNLQLNFRSYVGRPPDHLFHYVPHFPRLQLSRPVECRHRMLE